MSRPGHVDCAAVARPRTLIAWALFLVMAGQFLLNVPNMWSFPKSDFGAYYYAASQVADGDVASIYRPRDPDIDLPKLGYPRYVAPYLYPVPFAIALVPLTFAGFPLAWKLWFGFSLSAGAIAYIVICRKCLSNDDSGVVPRLLLAAAFLGMGAGQQDLCMGNCNILMLMLIILALPPMKGRVVGPVALALASWIKIKPVPLAISYILSRNLRALAVYLIAVTAVFLAAAAVVGAEPFVDYLKVTRHLSQGTGRLENQSLHAFFSRLFTESGKHIGLINRAGWVTPAFIASCTVVWGFTIIAVFRNRADQLFVFAGVLSAVTVTSPISWGPHLVLMLVAICWLLHFSNSRFADFPERIFTWEIITACVIILLLVVPFSMPTARPVRGVVQLLLLSREFFGAFSIWAVLTLLGMKNVGIPVAQKLS